MSWLSDKLDDIGDFLNDVWDDFVDFGKDLLEDTMALFNIEGYTVQFTDVQSIRLIPDEQNDSVTELIFQHATVNRNMAKGWMGIHLHGVRASVDRFMDYAETSYIYGLPTVAVIISDFEENAAKTVVEGIEGAAINVETYTSGPLYVNDYVKYVMQGGAYAFDYETNLINLSGWNYTYLGYTVLGGTGNLQPRFLRSGAYAKVYYLDYSRVTVGGTTTVTITEEYEIWKGGVYDFGPVQSAAPYDVVYDDKGEPDSDWREIIWIDTADPANLFNHPDFAAPTNPDKRGWAMLTYHLQSADDTETKIWMYDRNLGTYPTLDIGIQEGLDDSRTLPVIPIRHNFVSADVDLNDPWYKTSNTLVNKIGLDLGYLLSEVNSNPDLDKIREVSVLFGLNIYTESDGGRKAIRNFVERMFVQQGTTETEFNAVTWENPVFNHLRIDEQDTKQMFQWNYVKKTFKAGNAGAPFITVPVGGVILGHQVENNYPKKGGGTIFDEEEPTPEWGNWPQSILHVYDQVSASNYWHYEVHGFVKTTTILDLVNTAHGHVHVIKDIDFSTPENEAASRREREGFNIPLSLEMLEGLTPSEEEAVLNESLRMLTYSNDSVYLEYYETSKFAIFVEFVGWFITIISLGAGKGFVEAAKRLLTQYILSMILIRVLEELDSDFARALAIATYAAASVYAQSGKGFADIWGSAEDMMLAVNAIQQGITTDTAIQAAGLQAEIDEFESLAQDREEELQAALDYLATDSRYSVFYLRETLRNDTYEKADAFYDRTIHTGNPGPLSLTMIENFVEQSLQLPRLE